MRIRRPIGDQRFRHHRKLQILCSFERFQRLGISNEELVWDVELGYVELGDGFEHGNAVVEALYGGGMVNDGGVWVVVGEILQIEVPFIAVKFVNYAIEWTLFREWLGNVNWDEIYPSFFCMLVQMRTIIEIVNRGNKYGQKRVSILLESAEFIPQIQILNDTDETALTALKQLEKEKFKMQGRLDKLFLRVTLSASNKLEEFINYYLILRGGGAMKSSSSSTSTEALSFSPKLKPTVSLKTPLTSDAVNHYVLITEQSSPSLCHHTNLSMSPIPKVAELGIHYSFGRLLSSAYSVTRGVLGEYSDKIRHLTGYHSWQIMLHLHASFPSCLKSPKSLYLSHIHIIYHISRWNKMITGSGLTISNKSTEYNGILFWNLYTFDFNVHLQMILQDSMQVVEYMLMLLLLFIDLGGSWTKLPLSGSLVYEAQLSVILGFVYVLLYARLYPIVSRRIARLSVHTSQPPAVHDSSDKIHLQAMILPIRSTCRRPPVFMWDSLAVDWNDREDLLDAPEIRNGGEDRKINMMSAY
ncbi:hypothetical protein LXL04_010899 [Taraxacum kok-saghyz]